MLRAYSLFEKDVEYIVQGGKVLIVDKHTGRVMHGRQFSDGMHQAIEAKENVAIQKRNSKQLLLSQYRIILECMKN